MRLATMNGVKQFVDRSRGWYFNDEELGVQKKSEKHVDTGLSK
jgi:uncharacterized protein YneR